MEAGMMSDPFILQHGTRQAVIRGRRVQLFTVKERDKKRPLVSSILPEDYSTDAWYTAMLWLKQGWIDYGAPERQQH
jgi:hypothetical protein